MQQQHSHVTGELRLRGVWGGINQKRKRVKKRNWTIIIKESLKICKGKILRLSTNKLDQRKYEKEN